MSVFDRLKSSKRKHPFTLAIYGPPGAGKTRFASEFPEPLYLYVDGEEPPDGVEFEYSDEIKSYAGLLDTFSDLLTTEHSFQTVIIDSIDKLEPMVWAATCARNAWDVIDSNDKGSPTAFGKGYLAADVEWREYYDALAALNRAGVFVVQILHSETKPHNDPIVDSYDRYKPKLQKRALDMIYENCKALLFINRRLSVKQVDVAFSNKKISKPEGMSGAERVVYTDERAGFLAKNRLNNAPASFKYQIGQGYAELSKYFDVELPANDNAAKKEAA